MKNKLQFRPACFAVNTPYQLINAITIVQGKQLEADIYIFGMFKDFQIVAEKLAQHRLFSKVIPVDCCNFRSINQVKALLQVLFSRKETRSFLEEDIAYETLYVSSRAHIKQIFQHELQRRNKDLKIIIFEDGLGTYESRSSVLNTSPKRKIVEKSLGWNSFAPNNTSVLVSRPELFELPAALATIPVKHMPAFSWTQSNIDLLLDIFSVDSKDLITEKVILFDVTRGVYHNDLGVQTDRLDACYEIFIKAFKKENIICKPHPRSKNNTAADVRLYNRTGIPVEVLYAGMENLEDRILVGNWSTALYTPKMLFGKEPFIIDLHKILYKDDFYIASSLYNKMHNIYDDRSRIMAPESMQELDSVCQIMANTVI